MCLGIRLHLTGRAIDPTHPRGASRHPTQGYFLIVETPIQLQFSPDVVTLVYAVKCNKTRSLRPCCRIHPRAKPLSLTHIFRREL